MTTDVSRAAARANGAGSASELTAIISAFDRVPRAISESEFRRFQELIYREAGIWLSQAKAALLVGRLAKRLRHHRLHSYKDYYQLVVESPEERIQMLDAVSTNETHFFREPRHFELLHTTIFPRWAEEAAQGRRRRIRVWSAGCSTGQEPYSLAMTLLDHFPAGSGWEIEIVATDISTRALEIARQAVFPMAIAREIPNAYLKAFMLKGIREQADLMKAGPDIRAAVRFFRLNLNDDSYPFQGHFDLIFCRNVLIYFDRESRGRVTGRLLEHLSPQGYLFVGHAESLHEMNGKVRSVIPTVYTPMPKAGAEHNATAR